MHSKKITRSAIASGIAAALIGGYAGFGATHSTRAEAATAAVPTVAARQDGAAPPAQPALAASMNFSGIVQQFGPAVVNISVTGKSRQVPTASRGDDQDQRVPRDPLSQFFRGFPRQQQPNGNSARR